MRKLLLVVLISVYTIYAKAQLQEMNMLNDPVDISGDFFDFKNTYYLADQLASFDPASASGLVQYKRHTYETRQAFDNMLARLIPAEANEFPGTEYMASPELPFQIQFTSARTVRIKMTSGPQFKPLDNSLMLVNGKAQDARELWKYTKIENGHQYESDFGKVIVNVNPWHVSIFNAEGKLLTSTMHMEDVRNTYTPVLPFSYVRRANDYSRSMAAVFTLSPQEKLFGCGESFTQFNKRGQKVVLWVDDANGVQNETMYKPIPFYMSNRGYGVFMHHSTPITCDFGKYYNAANAMMIGDDEADIFIFIGEPKDILNEYTNLTGKAKMPPLWSFGFWMSRITYFSEKEGREVAKKLREFKVPADVLHFDTGWFGVDWRCDYEFANERFDDADKMIKDLLDDGFHISLWQLPYFTPKNTLFNDIIEKDLAVKDRKGNIPYEDAVLDFSNPEAVTWYQGHLGNLLEKGVGAIKVDFGEAAPANGIFRSGRTGFYEHNLYPLRYNMTVAEVTDKIHDNGFIWARSAWAGSQRYPVHWGGDAATSNTAMAATLRGGLSFGVSGFSFWSHDIGGFVTKSPENLYKRWTPFGMLSSHVRSHGEPPTEPWEYGDEFLKGFIKADNMRYQLMPYIYTQSKICTLNGLPMMRALFIEYPNDPGAWLVDDQYLFGNDMLVAPLLEDVDKRNVYLPENEWVDYQTGKSYGPGWHEIAAGDIPVVVLVKKGALIPHIKLAQSTKDMDWSTIDLHAYAANGTSSGFVYLPGQESPQNIVVENNELIKNPFGKSVKLNLISK